ncbi:Allantoicase [hydrothermal vent metagenome]|uniref:Allantoicase n=1 Tax=hydrothermal vent metagenome TaxID=652676 RepID=A0A3B0RGP7_9ZZZZ
MTTAYINLAQPRLGAKVVHATDDFFADKARLILGPEPVFVPDLYDDNGKWMDGWESRRKRVPGHDHCTVRLGQPGRVFAVEIDTRHFTGNFPPFASVEACVFAGEIPPEDTKWSELVAKTSLQGDSQARFEVQAKTAFTHIRLHIYPDGGVARLRVFGRIERDWSANSANEIVDLAALELGGRPIGCNDAHFGTPENMIAPGLGANMGDGWETRRRREPGHDWAVLALAHPGKISKVLLDTKHFKGNYPDRFFLQAALCDKLSDSQILAAAKTWPIILPEQKLSADNVHEFALQDSPKISHIRLNIIPDGGVSRLRLFGTIA